MEQIFMEQSKFIRKIALVRYIHKCNREGIYPDKKAIAKEMCQYTKNDVYNDLAFERDKDEIRDWGFKISCNKDHLYELEEKEITSIVKDFFTAYLLFSARKKESMMPDYVETETRNHTGDFEYIAKCMEAIEEHCQLHLRYNDYRDDSQKDFVIQPYKLKHKDYKWYVLAVDTRAPEVPFKAFALERILRLESGEKHFKPDKSIDFVTPYRDAFGMFTDAEPQRLVLQFDHRDGNYLEASRIHHSQKLIAQDAEHITFELYVKPTLDLIMELMKRTWSLKIIEPVSLRERFLNYWKEAIERNS